MRCHKVPAASRRPPRRSVVDLVRGAACERSVCPSTSPSLRSCGGSGREGKLVSKEGHTGPPWPLEAPPSLLYHAHLFQGDGGFNGYLEEALFAHAKFLCARLALLQEGQGRAQLRLPAATHPRLLPLATLPPLPPSPLALLTLPITLVGVVCFTTQAPGVLMRRTEGIWQTTVWFLCWCWIVQLPPEMASVKVCPMHVLFCLEPDCMWLGVHMPCSISCSGHRRGRAGELAGCWRARGSASCIVRRAPGPVFAHASQGPAPPPTSAFLSTSVSACLSPPRKRPSSTPAGRAGGRGEPVVRPAEGIESTSSMQPPCSHAPGPTWK